MRRIDHVGIAVEDVSDAGRFLTEVLGTERVGPATPLPDQGVVVQFYRAGDDQIELLAPMDPNGTLARFIAKRGEGLHHICFEVDDIERELDALNAASVPLVDRHSWRSPHGHAAYIHPKAWRGVAIELRQPYGSEGEEESD